MSVSSKNSASFRNLQMKQQSKVDVHGVTRGLCTDCTECPQFVSTPGHVLCTYCGCPPAKHERLGLVRDRKRGRESESKELTDSDNDSDLSMDSESEETSSGVSSSSGNSRRQRRRHKWRPSVQVTAPPPRVSRLISGEHVDMETQLLHTWNENDSSPNIYVKTDDRLTFHRNPVYQTTDAIRGKAGEDGEAGYTVGLHVWRISWPHDFRGTHPVVGVATRDCHLTEAGYRRLVGSTTNSWGWCLKSLKVYHDSRKFRNGVSYPRDIDDKLRVPDNFYMILDMDRGTLAFQVGNDFLGVAFSGLRGEELYPMVSAVWGHCEVTLTYLGNHYFETDNSD